VEKKVSEKEIYHPEKEFFLRITALIRHAIKRLRKRRSCLNSGIEKALLSRNGVQEPGASTQE
jgi:hypothetical protein